MRKELGKYISSISKENYSFDIFLIDDALPENRTKFLCSFYNSFGYRTILDETWFKWYYLDNPYGICNNYIIKERNSEKFIGGFGFAPIKYKYDDCHKIGRLAVNGFINRPYNGQGIYATLISEGLKNEQITNQHFFSFPHKNNLPSVRGHEKSMWTVSLELEFFEKKIETTSKKAISPKKEFCYDDLKELDFNTFNLKNDSLFIRELDFIKWRFQNRPNKKYSVLILNDTNFSGYMILGFYLSKENIKRCQICDYRVSNLRALGILLQRAEETAVCYEMNILDVLLNPNLPDKSIFEQSGLTKRNEGYNLMTYPTNQQEIFSRSLVNYADFDAV